MKINNPYTRQLIYGLIFLGMYIIAPLFFSYTVKGRANVRLRKDRSKWHKFLWLFLNDTKKSSNEDIDYGDYGRFSHNWIGAIKQNLFRNSHWNFKINYLLPNKGTPTNVKGNMTLCNLTKYGKQSATYNINGEEYFRASYTGDIVGCRVNYQIGATTNRYLYKVRLSRDIKKNK
jgi:hypothetical protein